MNRQARCAKARRAFVFGCFLRLRRLEIIGK
ncbi:hypothetical protein Q669_17075 [Labrenzia sp. C1B10]|nr:hypothetical protein Q669_17075 [Labrenzia sp. C1B10]ERS05959.1 hypothetical protein Q675_27375 [Labrenzia sp. C1B70]